MVPMAIAWKWIYDYNYGILNYALSFVGMPPVAWLTDPDIALWALIIMGVWKVLGYNLILFLVGIRNIPASYIEAASLDGADAWQRFRHVTLPLLKPILLYVLVTSTINAFNVFTQVYVMTLGSQAAPGQAVRVLVFDIYQNALPVFPHGLCLGRGGDADHDRARLHADPVPLAHAARRSHDRASATPHAGIALSCACGSLLIHGILMPGALFMVLPMLWMLATSFKPPAEIVVWPPHLLPQAPTLDNFAGIFETAPFAPLLRQQRRHLAGRDAERRAHLDGRRRGLRQIPLPRPQPAVRADLATAIVPFESYMIPLYLQLIRIDWINTYQGDRAALPVHGLRHLPDAPARPSAIPDRISRGGAGRRRLGMVDPAPGDRAALGQCA